AAPVEPEVYAMAATDEGPGGRGTAIRREPPARSTAGRTGASASTPTARTSAIAAASRATSARGGSAIRAAARGGRSRRAIPPAVAGGETGTAPAPSPQSA